MVLRAAKHQWLIKKMPDGPTTTAAPKRAEFVSEQGLGMRVHRVCMSFAISIGCGIASQNVAFSQEYRGTAEHRCLHAGRLAAVRRADPRCGQNRGVLAGSKCHNINVK